MISFSPGSADFGHISKDVASSIFKHLSPKELMIISHVCKNWFKNISCLLESQYPYNLFPKEKFPVTVLDISSWTKGFGEDNLGEMDLTCPVVNKRAAIARLVHLYTLADKIEGNAGVTILTRPKGLTWKKLIELAKPLDFEVNKSILDKFGDEAIDKASVEILTNSLFVGSKFQKIEEIKDLVEEYRCKLPRALSVASLAILTDRIFGTCPFFGRLPGEKGYDDDDDDNNFCYTACSENSKENALTFTGGPHPEKADSEEKSLLAGAYAIFYSKFGAAGSIDVPLETDKTEK